MLQTESETRIVGAADDRQFSNPAFLVYISSKERDSVDV